MNLETPKEISQKIPQNGFYFHYKHDPHGPVNNYAYEVVGVGYHTEEDGNFMVVYRPIYESTVYKAGRLFDLRPLDMWIGTLELDGKLVKRFEKITDAKTISELEKVRGEMYD